MNKSRGFFWACMGLCIWYQGTVKAQEEDFFDSGFLFNPSEQTTLPSDLSIFRHSNRVLPGEHTIIIMVNQRSFGEHVVRFIASDKADTDAIPCLTVPLLNTVGVKTSGFVAYQDLADDECVDLSVIPEASYSFNASTSTLSLSVPQAAIDSVVRGAIPISEWNQGETALWTSYQVSHFRSSMKSFESNRDSHTTFLGLRAGFNMGAWRFRSTGSLYHSEGKTDWNFSENYFERDLPTWRGRIRLGDSTTRGTTFTALRVRGVRLESDDSMLATSQQGYAPTVEGFANSSAQVTVSQNGNVIYSTFVAPGPFVINDLYAVPGGGDLEVEIQETGGQITRYVQPYSVLPAMLRQGRWQYSATFGKYRSYRDEDDEPMVGEVTLAHGLPAGITAYGGVLGSKNYFSGSVGLAFNLKEFGGLSTDIVQSYAKDHDGKNLRGHSIRAQYAKNILTTGTNFRFMGYRYSSKDYRTLDQTLSSANQNSISWNKSHEYQIMLSQNMKSYGSVSLSYAKINYHDSRPASDSMGISYSKNIGRVGVNVSYNQVQSEWQSRNRSVMLNLNIPLGSSSMYAGYSFSRQNNGDYAHSANLSGTALEDHSLSYSVRAGVSRENGDRGNNVFASTNYKHSVGQVGVSVARNHKNTQMQVNASGSVVVDKEGVLLGQYLNDTAIIVEVPGAEGVALQSHPSIKTNQAGRALIPYASPYRENSVALAPDYQSDTVTLQQNIRSVVPTQGALVRVVFDTELGRSILFTLMQNGDYVPFGAVVYDAEGNQKGIVGPVGRLWLTGLEGAQTYNVSWGDGQETNQCFINVEVGEDSTSVANLDKELVCA